MLRSQWAKKESDVAMMLRVEKCTFFPRFRAGASSDVPQVRGLGLPSA